MKIYLYEDRKDVFLDAFYPGGGGRDLPPLDVGAPLPAMVAGAPAADMQASGTPVDLSPAGALPAAVICPGGGYRLIGTTEGRPVSDKFTDAGYAAFVLHYTVGDGARFEAENPQGPQNPTGAGTGGWAGFAPLLDLTAALSLLHERSAEFGIDPSAIVLAGFSAGGHLCAGSCFSGLLAEKGLQPKALILTYPMGGGEDSGGAGMPQPDFDIAAMPYARPADDDPADDDSAAGGPGAGSLAAHGPGAGSLAAHGLTRNIPPVFLWHAKDDAMVPFAASVRLDERLTAEGIPHVFFVYEHGIHARPFVDPDWWYKALDWLNEIFPVK